MSVTSEISKRISAARKAKKLSRQQLADKLGRPVSYVHNIEMDNGSVPRLENLMLVAEALSTSVAFFIGETPEMSMAPDAPVSVKMGSQREVLLKMDAMARNILSLRNIQSLDCAAQWAALMRLEAVTQNPDLLLSLAAVGRDVLDLQKALSAISERVSAIQKGLHEAKTKLFQAENFAEETEELEESQTAAEPKVDLSAEF